MTDTREQALLDLTAALREASDPQLAEKIVDAIKAVCESMRPTPITYPAVPWWTHPPYEITFSSASNLDGTASMVDQLNGGPSK